MILNGLKHKIPQSLPIFLTSQPKWIYFDARRLVLSKRDEGISNEMCKAGFVAQGRKDVLKSVRVHGPSVATQYLTKIVNTIASFMAFHIFSTDTLKHIYKALGRSKEIYVWSYVRRMSQIQIKFWNWWHRHMVWQEVKNTKIKPKRLF